MFPTQFRHGNGRWRIRHKRIMKDGWLGLTHADKLRVTIDPDLPEDLQRETVFHELCHVAFSRQPHGLSHEKEETVVKVLTPNLLGILRANPELVKYLMED